MKTYNFILCAAIILSACSHRKTINEAQYSGKDISEKTEITRDKNTKIASLSIETNGDWKVYVGSTVETIDFSDPLLKGSQSGTFQLDVPTDGRSYFQVITKDGSTILAERHLPMQGGFNFRDLGGYKTQDGKFVKWGKIIRSDDLYNLTDEDLTYLASLPLISIVDFRTKTEVEQAPDKLPSSTSGHYQYYINPGNLNVSGQMSSMMEMDMNEAMKKVNVSLVKDSASIIRYQEFFKLLQDEKNIPLLFHCSAGKDRTGMGAALILAGLGVDEQTIMQDYLLSNVYLKEKYAKIKDEYPHLSPLFEVKAEFLKAGLDEIKKEYGTIEKYLRDVLQVDITRFREMYLVTSK